MRRTRIGRASCGRSEGAPGRPARYRSDRPIWADTAFAALAAVTTGTAVLAAVRSATAGLPVTAPAAAPFGEGRWLFSHNGLIRGWPGAVAGLAAELPVTDLLTLDAPTDSALLWALVRHRLRAGDDPAAVLAGVVRAVAAAAPGSRLNLLLTDGTAVWATTWTHALSVRVEAGAVTVASEPSDGERRMGGRAGPAPGGRHPAAVRRPPAGRRRADRSRHRSARHRSCRRGPGRLTRSLPAHARPVPARRARSAASRAGTE